MLKRLDPKQATLRFAFDGRVITARPGDTVAAALLAADAGPFRATPVSGAPRVAYCMMGVCFDCLVQIDGVANRQACLVTVAEGMQVQRQRGAKDVA